MLIKKLVLRSISFLAIIIVTVSIFVSAAARGKKLSPETVYSNPAPITINTHPTPISNASFPAAPYPSQIAVSGMTGTVTRVAVTLKGLTHNRFSTVDLLLVGPGGEKFDFLSDSGGDTSVEDHVFTISDDAPAPLVASLEYFVNYQPTNADGGVDAFPAPAPAGPYPVPPSASFASVFNGTNPNGTWSLYAADDQIINAGSINNGWSIEITTTGSPATTFSNTAVVSLNDTMTPATPYGSTINVSGVTGVISDVNVTINGYSHTIPHHVDMLLVDPNGKGVVILSDAGISAVNNATMTFDDAAAGTFGGFPTTGVFKPSDLTSDGNSGEVRDTFPAPAPYGQHFDRFTNNKLSNFNGASPNGDWKLYVVDDTAIFSGSIAGGWSLEITTVPDTQAPATCAETAYVKTSLPVGANPSGLTSADFNNDTEPDIAVANQGSNDVSIYLGNGDGTFGSQGLVSAGSGPFGIMAGKFNADSNWDLAVTNSAAGTVSVMLGNGNGTFSAASTFSVGQSPLSIAGGDFNGDAKTDLAVANYGGFFAGSVSILIGNGSGGFTAGRTLATRTQPASLIVGFFNNDTRADLAVAAFGANTISTYFGTGVGTFSLSQDLVTGSGPAALEGTDFNGDGFLDLLSANYNADNTTKCFGSVSGQFSCTTSGIIGERPISVTSGDFTGTGKIIEAVALRSIDTVKIFSRINGYTVAGQNPSAVKAVDFNGDGKADLATANFDSNDVTIGIGRCAPARNHFDFSGDHKADFTVWRPLSSFWYDQQLDQNAPVLSLGQPTDKIVPADYDGDGVTDFAAYRPENGLWVVRNSDGNPLVSFTMGQPGDVPVPADYDGDSKADLAVFRPGEGKWYIRRSSDHTVINTPWGMSGDVPVPADFDADGKADLAVIRPSAGDWYVSRSSDNVFQFAHWGAAGDKAVAGDYDGDLKADFAVYRPTDGGWYILRSSDNGFTAISWGTPGDLPAPGDYDRDGKVDTAIFRPSDQTWYVLKSLDGGLLYAVWGAPTDIPAQTGLIP